GAAAVRAQPADAQRQPAQAARVPGGGAAGGGDRSARVRRARRARRVPGTHERAISRRGEGGARRRRGPEPRPLGRNGARELGRKSGRNRATTVEVDMSIDIESLRNDVSWLANLEEPARYNLASASEQTFARGMTILRAHEPARAAYIVREGGVKEILNTPEGKEV